MTARSTDVLAQGEALRQGVYVYGIVRTPASLPEDLPVVGDQGGQARIESDRDLAAVVSDLDLDRPLGTREDLLAHERVLDGLAERTTVLPMRFPAVIKDVDAVREELLRPHHDHFEAILSELGGLVQFTVRGRYVAGAHLREIVLAYPEIRELRESLRELPDDAGYPERVRLGELVNQAVMEKRVADRQVVLDTLSPHAVVSSPHDVSDEDTAVSVAFLVEREKIARFEQAVDELGRRWENRVRLHLLGPLAPWDFLPR